MNAQFALRVAGRRAARFLPSALVDAVRAQAFNFPAAEVTRVLDALEAAGLDCALLGGWAVDALARRQTRRHSDLDVALETRPGATDRALSVLAALGYDSAQPSPETSALMPYRVVVRDARGRTVDLVPILSGPGPADDSPFGHWTALPVEDLFAIGRIGPRRVRCASPAVQDLLHRGYRLRRRDRRDIRELEGRRSWSDRAARALSGPPAALVVEVPATEAVVADLRRRHDPGAARGVPAHITALYPFRGRRRLDHRTRRRLKRIAASVEPFEFSLSRVEHFPTVTYLAPEPAAPFVALTERVWEQWPELPPFDGQFEDIVPHLTVAEGDHDPAELAAVLAPRLPIRAEAAGLTLLAPDRRGHWARRATFPFGSGASGGKRP